MKEAKELNKKNVGIIAENHGYLIEFEVSKTLKEINKPPVHVEMGHLVGPNNIEIDVVAAFSNRQYLIECKGNQKGSGLILVKAPLSMIKKEGQCNAKFLKLSKVGVGGNQLLMIREAEERGLRVGNEFHLFNFDINNQVSAPYTINGDFYKPDKKGFDKNDPRNNLYKAQQQICEAIEYFSPFEGCGSSVIPMIVTNSDIWVIDYENGENPEVTKHKWVIHRVVNRLTNPRIQKTDSENAFVFHLLITNKHHLKELVTIINNFRPPYPYPKFLIKEAKVSLENLSDTIKCAD